MMVWRCEIPKYRYIAQRYFVDNYISVKMKNINLTIDENMLLTPQQTMETVLEAIKEVIPYDLAVIMSKEENDHLKVRYASGPLKNEKLMQFEIELDDRPDISRALELGEVRLVEETEDPDHHDTYDGVLDLPLGHSCMLAPLQLNNRTLGLMTLDHRECDIFTSQRVKIAETLARIVALALAQSLATDKLLDLNEALIYERNKLIGEEDSAFSGMIGRSKKWMQVIERIKLVAPTGSHVMVLGETGTGKELVANSIHRLSQRANAPFIALNCSALNSSLAESELFGHEKGAFTGAVTSRKGRFELANKGTLFLDEIGDLPLEIQPKLLRAIQEGSFERVGGEATIKSDVRIICATHVNLEEKVQEGKFREDLYYRLNVFPVVLPPLRERKEDISLLAARFLERISQKFGGRHFYLSDSAMKLLNDHEWNGNIRELQNTLERAAIMTRTGLIKPEFILFESEYSTKATPAKRYVDEEAGAFDEEVKKVITRALEKCSGKIYGKGGAAELLGLKPTTLQSKMKKLGIELP